MVKFVSDQRSIILSYNTVERLLLGDFFHFNTLDRFLKDLEGFDKKWSLIGLGTTNWYRRNGEVIVDGVTSNPCFLWADPQTDVTGSILDLMKDSPSHPGDLKSPFVGKDPAIPQFPFLAIAVCNPEEVREFLISAGANLHQFIQNKCPEENIGLAAIHAEGEFEQVQYTTACYLPIGGIDPDQGYAADKIFKSANLKSGIWHLRGLYGVNPTIQSVLSVSGHPLHLHGYTSNKQQSGHVNLAIAAKKTRVTVYTIKDINISIKNLDIAQLAVKKLE